MNSTTTSSSEAAFALLNTLVCDSEDVKYFRYWSLRLYAIAAPMPDVAGPASICSASLRDIFRYSRIGSPGARVIGVAVAARSARRAISSSWKRSICGRSRGCNASSEVITSCSSTNA